MDIGLLILRVVVGALFVGHGTQKLFGWFGGYGVQGTGGWLHGMGFRPGQPMAVLVGVSEAGGGLLLMLGLLTPLGCAAIVGVMTTAILAVHAEKGMWNTNGGMEFPLVMGIVAVAIAFAGPGAYSVDHAIGSGLAGTGWGVAATLLGLLGGISVNAYRLERLRRSAQPAAGEERRAA
ncbi:MAG: DoxX family protein [Actinomycetota bacterium]|nr:DoxX family protein [Actinomycetota bacterium]